MALADELAYMTATELATRIRRHELCGSRPCLLLPMLKTRAPFLDLGGAWA